MSTSDVSQTDSQLLEGYLAGSQDAFAALTARYLPLVYRAALRQVPDSATAEDVTQSVFILLAQKAQSLRSHTVLTGWLLLTTRYSAADARRLARRRAFHEKRAAIMKAASPSAIDSAELVGYLDAALASLPVIDRDAVALHYLQQLPLEQVGKALGLSGNAVQHRISRALERLRGRFTRHGLVVSATTLAAFLATNTLNAAPVPEGLLASTSANAVAAPHNTLAGSTALTLAKGASALMTLAKLKVATGVVLVVLLVASLVLSAGALIRSLGRDMLAIPSHARSPATPEIITVSLEGAGRYRSIQAAIDAVPFQNVHPVQIDVTPGRYSGRVEVPRGKPFITLRGLGHSAADAWIGGDLQTNDRGVLAVLADDFRCENLTIENTGVPGADSPGAVYLDGRRQSFDRCTFIGGHSALQATRQAYFHRCEIRGSSDMINGAATAVFDDCDIVSVRESDGSSIAAPRTPAGVTFGLVFLNCRLRGGNPASRNVTLMRPWSPNGHTAFIHCTMDEHIAPVGWAAWGGRETTCRAEEFGSLTADGKPMDVSRRAPWGRELSPEQASLYTLGNIFPDWDPSTCTR